MTQKQSLKMLKKSTPNVENYNGKFIQNVESMKSHL